LPRALACLGLGVLYVVGNLGLRVAGIAGAWGALRSATDPAQRVAATTAFLGLALPLFVASEGVVWNTIQFGYFGLALLPLWAAPALWARLRQGSSAARICWAVVFAFLALPTTVQTLAWTRFGTVIPKAEVEALAAIKARTKPGSPVLISPFPVPGRVDRGFDGFSPPVYSDESSYVPALCARPSYFSSPLSLAVLRVGDVSRRAEIARLFQTATRAEGDAWLKARGIEAIYQAKPD
ncbi:MAG: hypothetical protein HYZ74_04040, partial [Elusimicrobia bacterium]|nr:hypothetical protein [Elusimicrobiota bacterium]